MATHFDLDAVRREHVGREIGASAGRYPLEYEPIRRYCDMVEDTNPLFLDPEAARAGPHGEVVCPPALVPSFAGSGMRPLSPGRDAGRPPGFTFGVPTPGDRGINMDVSYEFFAPVRVGNRLSAVRRIADVFVKPIKLDPVAVWIVTETEIRNEEGQRVCLQRFTTLVHRSPEQVARESMEVGDDEA